MFVLVFLTLLVVTYWWRDYLRAVCVGLQLPGPRSKSLLGNVMILMQPNCLTDFMASWYREYGPLTRGWLLTLPWFIVLDPDDIQTILSSSRHTDKNFVYRFLHNFLGRGLITSNKWHHHRQLMQPIFHRTILNQFIDGFVQAARRTVVKIGVLEEADGVNLTPLVNACVLEVMNGAIFGIPPGQSNVLADDSPFNKGRVVLLYRLMRPWLLFDWTYSFTSTSSMESEQNTKLDVFTRKMIQTRRNILADPNSSPTCFLDHLIQLSAQHPSFTDDDIADEATTLMLAGQDTVGTAIAICLFLLAQHEHCQSRCHSEIDALFDSVPSTDKLTLDEIAGLHYLEQCIKETLRLYPSVPLLARQLSRAVIANHTLPTGSNVLLMPYATHRIEHIFPDPEHFNPDRFAADASKSWHPFAYIPFSAGPRNCIGQKFAMIEIMSILATILFHYEMRPVPGRERMNPVFRMTVRASGGLWVRLKKRR